MMTIYAKNDYKDRMFINGKQFERGAGVVRQGLFLELW